MTKYQKKEKKSLIDFGAIIKYIALTIVFALVIYGINYVVLHAISISPTGQVGNGILTLYKVTNTGAAFNLFSGQPEAIIAASFLAVAALAFVVLVFSAKLTHTAISAMSLLSAGILMNMADRISNGYVIDYIYCNFAPNFPMFNTADIMIVFGALGLILALFSKK